MSHAVDVTVDHDLEAPSCARRLLAAEFADLREQTRTDALLVISELVTNAVLHGSGAIHVRIVLDRRCLRVEVDDEGVGLGPPAPDSRGLLLVNALARDFGVRPTASGKTVWAELGL